MPISDVPVEKGDKETRKMLGMGENQTGWKYRMLSDKTMRRKVQPVVAQGLTFRSRNRCLIIFSRMKAKLTLIIVASQSVFLSIVNVTTKEPKMLEHRSRIKECVEK